MESIRKNFVQEFGKKEAQCMVDSAREHWNGINNKELGDDPFKHAILICIGYQCFEKLDYRKHHGFTVSHERLKEWIVNHGKLASHNGDCDYLALLAGVYNKYLSPTK